MLKSALVLSGVPDDSTVRARFASDGAVEFLWPGTGDYLPQLQACVADLSELLVPIPAGLTLQVPQVPAFNYMADPDRYGTALRAAAEVVAALRVPCLNHPAAVQKTGREAVAASLTGLDGLLVPTTIRLQPRSAADIYAAIANNGMRYPVIIRLTGTQTAQTQVLIRSAEDDDALYSIPWGGQSVYLTQYVDYADQDGWYRKMRISWNGEVVMLKSVMSSRSWAVHGGVTDSSQNDIEAAWLDTFESDMLPRYARLFRDIRQRLALDWFAMDCAIMSDGLLLLFEATACVSLFGSGNIRGVVSDAWRRSADRHREEFRKLAHAPSRWMHPGQ